MTSSDSINELVSEKNAVRLSITTFQLDSTVLANLTCNLQIFAGNIAMLGNSET